MSNVLFQFNDAWRLEYDRQQWIVSKKEGKVHWNHKSFIGAHKWTIIRALTRWEAGEISPEGMAAYEALPDTFREWQEQKDMQDE